MRRKLLARASGAKFRFEHLEPRHLFSVSPMNIAPPDADFGAGSDSPPAGQHSGQPLTNFNWLPMVYAGPNASVGAFNTLQLNGEVLVNGEFDLSVQWSLISGPGNAAFGNSSDVNTTVQFTQAGTYELQLSATNHGITASDRMFVTVSAANVVNIDQAWLDAKGPGPYYLDQQGKTYVLQTDVTTDGTAFAIIAKDVTFDLNGHTITYNNAAPITILNGSFEAGNGAVADGWDFSHAPNAVRYDAAGRWIYNEVYDGDYSLKFGDTTRSEYVESTGTITLEANTTYSLSAMFEYGGQNDHTNPGVKGYVQLIGDGLPTRETFWNNSNWRGIQLAEGEFTTGETQETYTIRVGIERPTLTAWASGQSVTVGQFRESDGKFYEAMQTGTTGGTPPTHTSGDISDGGVKWRPRIAPFYIDDIKIQQTKNYGITTQIYSWATAEYKSEFTQYGTGTNATVTNGTLVQGQNNGSWSHGVMLHNIGGVTIDNLNVTIQGQNTSGIFGHTQANQNVSVIGSTFTSNVQTVTSRDSGHGAVILNLRGEISHNTILNGPISGIVAVGDNTRIHHNEISLEAKYSNAFGISFYSQSGTPGGGAASVHDNTITNYGDGKVGRGILLGGNAATAVYGNTIAVWQDNLNQEYQGVPIGGAYGIQVEAGSYKEIYDNSVTAYSSVAPASALRIGGSSTLSTNNHIHDNVFTAVRLSGTSVVNVALFDNVGPDANNRFINNTLESDSMFFSTGGNNNTVMESSILKLNDDANDSAVIRSIFALPTIVEFCDPTFADSNTRSAFDNGIVRYTTNQIDPNSSYAVSWTTAIQVNDGQGQPIAGATVVIEDKDGNEVFSGPTDENGRITTVLKQYKVQGNVKTEFGPYAVMVSHGENQVQQQISADRKQTIQLSASGASLMFFDLPETEGYPLAQDGTTVLALSTKGHTQPQSQHIEQEQLLELIAVADSDEEMDYSNLFESEESAFREAAFEDLLESLEDTLFLTSELIAL